MSWNHRVVTETLDGDLFYGVAEVYYDDNGTPWGYCYVTLSAYMDSDELKVDAERIINALQQPSLLAPDDFKGQESDDE